jgi:hypothetical protein
MEQRAAGPIVSTEPMLTTKNPPPGDRIIFERADGQYDVREVSASGEHQTMCHGLTFEAARDMAHRQLEAAHGLWVCHHSSPDTFGPFSRRPMVSRRTPG